LPFPANEGETKLATVSLFKKIYASLFSALHADLEKNMLRNTRPGLAGLLYGWLLFIAAHTAWASNIAPTPTISSGGATRGIAVVLGGAVRYDNDAIWQRIVELAGGKGAKFAVLATASEDPVNSAAAIVNVLNRHGALAQYVPIVNTIKGTADDARKSAADPQLVEKILRSDGIFFSGGAQERITATLIDAAGRDTPALAAIWQVFNRGGVVAGTSAGAAIMSTTMFRDAPDVLKILKFGARDGNEIAPGLGFVGPDLFVDQHFLKRGRLGRMLPVMVQKKYRLGLGVDENSGAIVGHGEIEIIGSKGALVADLGDAVSHNMGAAFGLKNAKITFLERGDRLNLKSKLVTPSAQKLAGKRLDPNAQNYAPYFDTQMFHPDILSEGALLNAISNLIDNKNTVSIGLAFRAPDESKNSVNDKSRDLGFEFKFRKGPDSLGYFTSALGGENYTVINIYLDVSPVSMATPLYRPFSAAPVSAPASASR
jgi:cyanophycinase